LKGTVVLGTAAFAFAQEIQGHSIVSLLLHPAEGSDPILFDPAEVVTLASVASQIIPTTDQPGAAEVGVVVLINEKASGDAELLELYKAGVVRVDVFSRREFGRPFSQLQEDQKKEILKGMEDTLFFKTIRRHTVEAFYGSPLGVLVTSGRPAGETHAFCASNEGFPNIDKKPLP